MKHHYHTLKIALDTSSLSKEDIDDLFRWEDEGGHPSDKPDALSSLNLPVPLHKKEIFEVVDTELQLEGEQVYLNVSVNKLSHR
ncbi:MAG: hypothetical protein R3281_13590 [Balneolaceae bacterium]|nr:hypothetical protein [Balneolaceae bacterium]